MTVVRTPTSTVTAGGAGADSGACNPVTVTVTETETVTGVCIPIFSLNYLKANEIQNGAATSAPSNGHSGQGEGNGSENGQGQDGQGSETTKPIVPSPSATFTPSRPPYGNGTRPYPTSRASSSFRTSSAVPSSSASIKPSSSIHYTPSSTPASARPSPSSFSFRRRFF